MTDLELDALVAEKVMGFTVRDGWIFEWRPSPCPDKMPGCLVLHSKEYPVLPRPYSTDIAEAWQVVNKFGNWHGFDFLIIMEAPAKWNKQDPRLKAGWFELGYDGYEDRAIGRADTVGKAICLAALNAVGVNTDD